MGFIPTVKSGSSAAPGLSSEGPKYSKYRIKSCSFFSQRLLDMQIFLSPDQKFTCTNLINRLVFCPSHISELPERRGCEWRSKLRRTSQLRQGVHGWQTAIWLRKWKADTGWPFRLFQTSHWHQNKSWILVHRPYTKSQLLFWYQWEVLNNLHSHPV